MATKKKTPKQKGKNIRVSDVDYETINNHCKANNFVMGAWVGSVCCNNINSKSNKK
jgi:hypothetical protein